MSSTEDNVLKQLIEGCLKGERKSQHKVYELYYGKMMGVCLRYAKSDDEAKDVLQDGFIKVFGNMQNYGWNGSFEGWIRRIIVNTAIDSFRKNKASIVRPDSDYVDNYKEEAEEEIEESELSRISAKRCDGRGAEPIPCLQDGFQHVHRGRVHTQGDSGETWNQ